MVLLLGISNLAKDREDGEVVINTTNADSENQAAVKGVLLSMSGGMVMEPGI